MEYTVQKLAKLAGVSTRTLRYYDEINLLRPARINSSGYRIYGTSEVSILQQIMFYRELGLQLEEIRAMINAPGFDEVSALLAHRRELLAKRQQLDLLIENVSKTIAQKEGRIIMTDQEKFEGFKQNLIKENENKYGEEMRGKYGSDTVEAAHKKLKNMSQEDHDRTTALEAAIKDQLKKAMIEGDPSSEAAQEVARLHKDWISFYWPEGLYSPDAHYGLAQMYTEDERFTAYYEAIAPGAASFIVKAIKIFTGM